MKSKSKKSLCFIHCSKRKDFVYNRRRIGLSNSPKIVKESCCKRCRHYLPCYVPAFKTENLRTLFQGVN